MTKPKTIYECSYCQAQYPKWAGRCDQCGKWGTISEANLQEVQIKESQVLASDLVDFSKINNKNLKRIQTGMDEFDRVLGAGIVAGSLVLIGGDPGIGKSTLALQIASQVSQKGSQILYVSAEESAGQVKGRIERLGLSVDKLKFLAENNSDIICATISKYKPDLVIIDSIQTIIDYGAGEQAGSITQVRLNVSKFLNIAKKNNTAIFLIGHVTKEGTVAGPKMIEHLVDTVLYLEGDKFHQYRILRTVKNRFGATNEVGIFEMQDKGLIEVKNPSQIFIEQRKQDVPGSIITCVMEGKRPILVEVQALTSKTVYGYPVRKSLGFDINRLQLLATVLSKRTQINVLSHDIYLNIAGGLKIQEPAADLAVVCAIYSAFKNSLANKDLVVFGEVGLGGEVRAVSNIDLRIKEALKLGFKKIIVPFTVKDFDNKVIKVKNIQAALAVLEN